MRYLDASALQLWMAFNDGLQAFFVCRIGLNEQNMAPLRQRFFKAREMHVRGVQTDKARLPRCEAKAYMMAKKINGTQLTSAAIPE